MYDAAQIKTGFLPLIGWRQNVDPAGWQLNSLTTSSSGLWYNDQHPLLTIDNLISIAPKFELIDPAQAAINTAFTNWVQQKTEAYILDTVEEWIRLKFERKTVKNLLQRNTLYTSTGNFADTIPSNSKRVGLEFRLPKSDSIKALLQEISIQLTANQNPLNIYLFEAGTKAAIQTLAVNYTGAGNVQWESVDWELDGEKTYYLLYDQDDLTGLAINSVNDYSLGRNGVTTLPMGRHIRVSALETSEDIAELGDLSKNAYVSDANYGLNVKMDVRCDYTDFILDQKDLFKGAVAKRVAIGFLRELAFNPESRVNRNQLNVTIPQILFEIEGDTQGTSPTGIGYEYRKALEAITFDMEGIEKDCLPCRKRGVKYSSI